MCESSRHRRSGFIGSHVVDRLLARGHQPLIFDLVPPQRNLVRERSNASSATSCDVAGACALAMRGCDAVVHLAAVADVDEVALDPLAGRSREHARHRASCSRPRATRASGTSSTAARSGSTATRAARPRSTRTRCSLRPTTSTRRRSSRARCTAARTGSMFGLDADDPALRDPARPPCARGHRRRDVRGARARGRADQHQRRRPQARQFVYVEDLADGIVARSRQSAAGAPTTLSATRPSASARSPESCQALIGDVTDRPCRRAGRRSRARAHLGRAGACRARLAADHDLRRRRCSLRRLGWPATNGSPRRARPRRASTAAPLPSCARSPARCSGRRRAAARRRRLGARATARCAIDSGVARAPQSRPQRDHSRGCQPRARTSRARRSRTRRRAVDTASAARPVASAMTS